MVARPQQELNRRLRFAYVKQKPSLQIVRQEDIGGIQNKCVSKYTLEAKNNKEPFHKDTFI